MISNSEVSFCVDTLLVETVLSDSKFYKTAGFVSDLLEKVKGYFNAHIDPKDPTGSVLSALAPGVLWALLSSIGLGKWGFLLGLLMDVFHIDVKSMLSSLYEKVKGMVSGGKKVSSEQIDAATESVAQEFSTPGSEQEAEQGYQNLQQKQQKQESAKADDQKIYSSLELLSDARMIRLALIDYEHHTMRLTKEAGRYDFLRGYGRSKARGSNLLARIFGWIVKIAFFSAGLMVAGDAVNAVLGQPSALTGTYQAGQEPHESSTPAIPSGPRSTQTKFPAKGDSTLPRAWPQVNNPVNIENMLVQFAKDVYSGLDGKENIIRNTPAFQAIKENIVWFNIHNEGSSLIFIPQNFTSKKGLVDYFIDDVAKSSAL